MSVPHECPRGQRCFDCHPLDQGEGDEIPAWMQRRVGDERPTLVPYTTRPTVERIDAMRTELRRLVDEVIRTAPEGPLRIGRVTTARHAGTAADEHLERLAYVLTRAHEVGALEVGEEPAARSER